MPDPRTFPASSAVMLTTAVVLAACGSPADGPEEGSVAWYEETTCTTAVVGVLSRQIVDEVRCMLPGALAEVVEDGAIDFTSAAVIPYLSPDARDDLLAVVAAGARPMRVTSMFRTVVQQYLVLRWFELGRCNIAAAARPGESNHESGRAIDILEHDSWIDLMAAHGWTHTVPGDDVHFDHPASPDHRGADVLAFQRLWNRNHSDDRIDEDGEYLTGTADRVGRAPADGFALGASCAEMK